MGEVHRVYFNKPQRLTQLIGANISVIVAGRRTGNTDSIAAPFVLRNMQRMPGSTGGIVVPTFKHGLTNTLPGLFAAWKRWGFERGIHYVIGRRPPMFSHFFQPLTTDGSTPLSPSLQQLQESMDTQIRALSGGDITKEKAVLEMDCWRAMSELNAKAKDYEEIKNVKIG